MLRRNTLNVLKFQKMIKQAEVATMSQTGAEGIIESISDFYTVSNDLMLGLKSFYMHAKDLKNKITCDIYQQQLESM